MCAARATVIAVISTAGCVAQPARVETPPQPDPVTRAIRDSARTIEARLERLNRLEQAAVRPAGIPEAPAGAQILNTPITLHWDGPPAGALRELARQIGRGWRFQLLGRPPVAGYRPVSVHEDSAPAFEVIQSIGWQIGESVGVVVSPETRRIALVYGAAKKP